MTPGFEHQSTAFNHRSEHGSEAGSVRRPSPEAPARSTPGRVPPWPGRSAILLTERFSANGSSSAAVVSFA